MATLNANQRKKDTFGKKYAKQIRNEGFVPAVIYGEKEESLSISLDPVQYVKELSLSEFKKNVIFEITIDDKKTERVITKEINVNPINNQFMHIDFQRVNDKSPLILDIPIKVVGISAGQRLGGVLVKPKATIKIKCFPTEIPVNVEVDITKLSIGDNVRANQIELKDSQTLVSNQKDILVKVESTKVSKLAQSDDPEANSSDDSNESTNGAE